MKRERPPQSLLGTVELNGRYHRIGRSELTGDIPHLDLYRRPLDLELQTDLRGVAIERHSLHGQGSRAGVEITPEGHLLKDLLLHRSQGRDDDVGAGPR
ncbi:hypothetical protein [Streptomyces mirabilis]|uniref:hypothetical protein n=1 Tax=Streptomyces mirabilis TaxID=68239 RepID=UPI0036A17C2B